MSSRRRESQVSASPIFRRRLILLVCRERFRGEMKAEAEHAEAQFKATEKELMAQLQALRQVQLLYHRLHLPRCGRALRISPSKILAKSWFTTARNINVRLMWRRRYISMIAT